MYILCSYDILQDDTRQDDDEFMKIGRVLQNFVKRAVDRAGMEVSSKEIDYVVAEMLMEEYQYFRLGKFQLQTMPSASRSTLCAWG